MMRAIHPDSPVSSNTLYLGVSLVVLVLGFQLAFYSLFSQFSLYDDEGAMLLRVQEFVENPSTYDDVSGFYGPLYYLHKYAIYHVLDSGVSHYINRLTTLVFWLLIAWVGALFVYRVTRSVTLGMMGQFQLLFLLRQLVAEPGHSHELGLLLVFTALLVSSCSARERRRVWVSAGLGACVGALLLVKVNLGMFLAAAVALALVSALPRTVPVMYLRRIAALLALLVPVALVWRQLEQAFALNFLVLGTSAIAGCLIVQDNRDLESPSGWLDVVACGMSAIAVVGAVFLAIVALGNSVGDIINSVIVRPLAFSAPAYVQFAPMSTLVYFTAPVALVAALFYRWTINHGRHALAAESAVAVIKLAYAAYALYLFNFEERAVFDNPLLIPLVWILLLQPNTAATVDISERFPRLLLCFLSAFYILQEFPVPGSQRIWTALLVVPVVLVCLSDALPVLVRRVSGRYSGIAAVAVCTVLAVGYYQKMNLAGLKSVYFKYSPLHLEGTGPMRLPPPLAGSLRALVDATKRHCDGVLSLPEFHSLYFWVEIAPPPAMTSDSILELEDPAQYRLIQQMEAYPHPCIVYSKENLRVRARNTPIDNDMPLARYIRSRYGLESDFGWIQLLTPREPGATP